MSENKKTVEVGNEFYEGFIRFLNEHKDLDFRLADDEDETVEAFKSIVCGSFEYIAATLGDLKDKTQPVELVIPQLATFRISYREGANGNWGVGVTFGPEFKAKAKVQDEDVDSEDEDDEE